nr:hypothetical protein [Clostridiales bacterium]
ANKKAIKLVNGSKDVAGDIEMGEKGFYTLAFTADEAGEYVLTIGADVTANNGNKLGTDASYKFSVKAKPFFQRLIERIKSFFNMIIVMILRALNIIYKRTKGIFG